MAQTSVLLPVPLGPMTILRFGPGKNSAEVYVTKFVNLTRRMAPGWYLLFSDPSPFNSTLTLPFSDLDSLGGPSCESSLWGDRLAPVRVRLLSFGADESGVPSRISS